jgi:putative transposase
LIPATAAACRWQAEPRDRQASAVSGNPACFGSGHSIAGAGAPTPSWLDGDGLHGHLLGRPVAGALDRRRAAPKYAARVRDADEDEASLWQSGLRQQVFLGDEDIVARMQALAFTEQRSAVDVSKAQRKSPSTLRECVRRTADRPMALRIAYRECGITMTAMAKDFQLSVSRISRLIAVAEAAGVGLGARGKT